MSRTKKGTKAPGYDYWSRRPMSGHGPSSKVKSITHKIERQQNKPKPEDFESPDEPIAKFRQR